MATTMLSAAREALEVAEALGASEPREVPATTPLELDDPASAWIVSRGRVVVFAQPPGGALHERRTPVVEVMTGGLVLAPPTDAAVRLIAVGIEPGTELRGLPASALTGHRGHRAAVLAGLVDDWLGAISAALEAEAPEAGVALSSGEPALIGPGEAAWAATHPVWVQAAEVGVFDARPEGDRLRVPVPARGWVRGYAELELVPHRSAEALQHADAIAGIDAFHRAALEMLRRRIDAADELVAERIRRRVGYEADLRHRTLGRLADVLGSDAARSTSSATTDELVAVMRLVGHEQGIEIVEPPRRVLATASDPLDAIARASGVRTRAIVTGPQWWRTDAAAFVGRRRSDGRPVAVVRRRVLGYRVIDSDGRSRPVDRTTIDDLAREGTALYRSLPPGPVSNRMIARFVLRSGWRELLWLVAFSLIGAGLALVPPAITEYLFEDVVPQREISTLGWMAVLLATAAMTGFGLAIVQRYAVIRIHAQMGGDLGAAIRDRLLDLPAPFYRRHASATLAYSAQNVARIQRLVTEGVVEALLGLPTGVATLIFAFTISPRLGWWAFAAIVAIGIVIVVLLRLQMPSQRATKGRGSRVFGVALEMLSGIAKIRVADAHDRAFARWGEAFVEFKRAFYRAQRSFVAITAIVGAAPAIGMMFLLVGAAALGPGELSAAQFLAFNTAFVESMVCFVMLAAVAVALASAIPRWEEMRPMFDEARERSAVQEDPGELRGAVEFDHVTFRYGPDEPAVLKEVSFAAAPGEFVALVGPSGAGKSSVLRLLLGFEQPELGSIRFDGKELGWIDPVALRRQMGTVLQGAQLLPGDVLSNIVGTRPIGLDEAWEAARIAGLAADIETMPMGMHTLIGESGGSFSGGQRQRLLIARAVAGRPRILLFDEATSALDGPTQAAVSSAIERMHATRIVIAHRLSTVRAADRIIVLDAGSVVQQGTYDELVETDGLFRRLALRQIA